MQGTTLQGTTSTLTVHQPIFSRCQELGHTCTTSGILQLGSTSAPSADDPLANVLGEVGLGEHCLDGVKLVLPHFDVKVLPSNSSATDQHLSDDMGLCLHLVIAPLDVVHEMGGDTSHGVLAHDLALGQEVSDRSGCPG